MKIHVVLLPAALLAILVCGCSTVPTRDYPETEDVLRIVEGKESGAELGDKTLVLFCSESPGIRFDLTEAGNDLERATAVVGKEAFAAFAVKPGTYMLNNRRQIVVRGKKIHVFELTPTSVKSISPEQFLDKYHGGFLPLTFDSTLESIEPSTRAVRSTTPFWDTALWYTGKSLYLTVAAPFYLVYYTCRGVIWFVVLRYAGVSQGSIFFDTDQPIVDWGQNLPPAPKSVLDTPAPRRVKNL